MTYSYLGSTFVARRAGTKHAINATAASSTVVTANVQGSRASTPNNMLVKVSTYFVNT